MMTRLIESSVKCIAPALLLSFIGSGAEATERAFGPESASSIQQIVIACDVQVVAVSIMSDATVIVSKAGGDCDTAANEETIAWIIPKMICVFKVVIVTTTIRIIEIGKARLIEAVIKHVRHVTYALPGCVKTATRCLLSHGSEMLDVVRAGSGPESQGTDRINVGCFRRLFRML